MKQILKDVIDEIQFIFKGKTTDTFLSPILFFIIYQFTDLGIAILYALIFATILFLYRRIKTQTSLYASIGLGFVLLAAVLAFVNQNMTNYFLPGIISNIFIFLVALVSILLEKPLAAYLSHLTRAFPLKWFERHDIKPAYMEVTFFWLFMFFLRSVIEIYLFSIGDATGLIWMDTIIGIPGLVIVLILSYIYGIIRLNSLKGPSVEEFLENKQPPFKGQKKGF